MSTEMLGERVGNKKTVIGERHGERRGTTTQTVKNPSGNAAGNAGERNLRNRGTRGVCTKYTPLDPIPQISARKKPPR